MEMEKKAVGVKEDLPNKEDLTLSIVKDIELGDYNGFVFSVPKLPRVLESVRQEQPLTSDIMQCSTHRSCSEESFVPNQCGRELRIPTYLSLVSLHECPAQGCLDLAEVRASSSLSLICRTTSLVNIPVNAMPLKREFLFDSLKARRRRTQSTNDLGKFVTGCMSATGPARVIISPVGHWISNTIERNDKRRLLGSPLSCHLGAVDTKKSLKRAMSVGLNDSKFSELVNSPSRICISSPQKPVVVTMTPGKQRYESDASDKTLFSCSSTNSTSSSQSTSSSCTAPSKGLLRCTWKNGIPNFVFSVDDQGEVYVANPWKVESSSAKAPDYMYFFHSRTDCKKERGSGGNCLSDLVGKMKVSSSLTLNSNSLKLMETEFILFGNEYHVGDMQSSTPTSRKNKGFPKKVVDIFRRNYSAKHKSTPQFGDPGFKFEDFSQKPCLNILGKLDKLDKEKILKYHLPTNLELAAIVVKDFHHGNSQDVSVGGWGLKFLEKVTTERHDTYPENCGESCLRNKSESVRCVNVLIPAGFHGGPKTKNGGPSSLTERWRLGGQCDCGGWDSGCPLTVLNNSSSNPKILPQDGVQEDCNSFSLFLEGSKEYVPTLKMVNIHEGLHIVYFQSSLSALQSFSIAVAVIHAQSPALCPKSVGIQGLGKKRYVCIYMTTHSVWEYRDKGNDVTEALMLHL
ncbi:cadherin EGF LAG seven-pass G-type receptor, putative (DUF3527) isoform X2 [Tasmannia lanceolata]|uniref:cadherin EGF LAG seven-pass G-type receptor, putative (DUF3527) isoform X2 n=1 Tax=Tasmannia lanceolata TaxID=3420 RepID=UPI0040631ABF